MPNVRGSVTDAVLDEIKNQQNRPLEPLYPVIIFDALRGRFAMKGLVKNKAVYLAIGIAKDRTRVSWTGTRCSVWKLISDGA
jgi:putative transposase